MGTWGTGILENDLSADVYGDFMDLYDNGEDPAYIHTALVEDYEEVLQSDEYINFWLGLAQAEWECGYKDSQTYKTVSKIVESKLDLSSWDNEDQNERHANLSKFLKQISTTRNNKRVRQKKKLEHPVYPEGTCLAIKLYIGGYGAAIVLKNEYDGNEVYSLIGGLKGIHQEIPAMETFEKRDWLYLTHHNFNNELHINWCDQEGLRNSKSEVEPVGKTAIMDTDPHVDLDELGIGQADIGWVENQIWKQDEWDNKNA